LGEIITRKVLLAEEQKGKGEKQEKNKNMKILALLKNKSSLVTPQ